MKNSIRAVVCIILALYLLPVNSIEAKERPLFIGDSRTVGILATVNNMSGSTKKVEGTYDGVDFICKSSTSYNYLKTAINNNPKRKLVISWMGVNGLTWSKYKEIYDKVLKDKKRLVLVTIGSVDRSKYAGGVTNAGIEKFNEQMLEYADKMLILTCNLMDLILGMVFTIKGIPILGFMSLFLVNLTPLARLCLL